MILRVILSYRQEKKHHKSPSLQCKAIKNQQMVFRVIAVLLFAVRRRHKQDWLFNENFTFMKIS